MPGTLTSVSTSDCPSGWMPFSQLLFDNLSWTFHTHSVWNGTFYHSYRRLSTLPHAPRFASQGMCVIQQVSLSLRLGNPPWYLYPSLSPAVFNLSPRPGVVTSLCIVSWHLAKCLASSGCSVSTDRLKEFCASCVPRKREGRALGTVIAIKATTQGPSLQHAFSHLILPQTLWWRDTPSPVYKQGIWGPKRLGLLP